MIWLLLACNPDGNVRGLPTPSDDTDVSAEDTDVDADTDLSEDTQDDTDTDTDTVVYSAAVYPFDELHSPITPFVRDNLLDIAANGTGLQQDVFMKVGASSLASTKSLHCFADGPVDLDVNTDLQDGLDHFLSGDANGSTPFDRVPESAVSGRTAGWAIDGPAQDELDLLNPQFALIHYGTNDMGWGTTYASAMKGFHENMEELLELLTSQGVVPVIAAISHRGDKAEANAWVPTYNAYLRGLAQKNQTPYVDWYQALDPLAGHGLSSDGIHVNGYSGGTCIFTPDGLEYGYNVRNLLSLEALDRSKRAVVDDEAPDTASSQSGTGTAADPYIITSLPFVHAANTASGERLISEYSCDDANESGPEVYYRLDLSTETAARAMIVDSGGTDVDVHLLMDTPDANACVDRDHRYVESTLTAGSWYITVDSWTDSSGDEKSGEYLLMVHEVD